MSTSDLTNAIEQSHAALGAILKGDPSVYQALYSSADDVTLGNPFGPYVRGRQKVDVVERNVRGEARTRVPPHLPGRLTSMPADSSILTDMECPASFAKLVLRTPEYGAG